jgi:RNA polymerase sigma factor (sigma-70 family)
MHELQKDRVVVDDRDSAPPGLDLKHGLGLVGLLVVADYSRRSGCAKRSRCNVPLTPGVLRYTPTEWVRIPRMSAAALAHALNAQAIPRPEVRTLSAEGDQILAARREPAAFEALVYRHQSTVFNFCFRMLGEADDAADVSQETFVQLYSHLEHLDDREQLTPWLLRVARNRCIDLIRRRKPLVRDMSVDDELHEPAADGPLPDELAERADLQRLLSDAIATLPPHYAEVVALRYAADRSFAEIASILECEEGAARVRFHRAKAQLRRYLHQVAADL